MLRAAIKNLLGHKLRMFLTGFSIILGVSFISGTYIFTDSISSTFKNLFKDVFSGVDVTVRPQQAEFGQNTAAFDESVIDTIRTVEGVSVASGGVGGTAQFLDREGKPIGGQGPPTIGSSWTSEAGLSILKIEDGGKAPEKAGEVVMDKATALSNNFKVGDSVKIVTNGPAEEFTITGIATFGQANNLGGATLAAFELKEAQRLFGQEGKFSEINIKAQTGVDANTLRDRVAQAIPLELEAVTGEQQSNEQISDINQNLGFINTALLAFAGIAIFVGSFIIQNTFRIIVAQRSKELALLRAIGATRFQVVSLVIYEAIAVSLLSSTIGIFAGLIISSAVRALMNGFGFGIPSGDLTIAPRTVYISLSVGVIVTLVAALLPAIKASQVSPVEALRDNEASGPNRKSLFKRGFSGILLASIGAFALIYGLNGDIDNPLYAVGAGVVLMFIGVSVIAPLLSIPLTRFIGAPLVKLRGIPARLARDNAKRTPRRTASTAAALMIGVSLVTMLSIMATTFKSEITRVLDDSFPADLTVYSNNIGQGGPGTGGFSVNVYDQIKDIADLKTIVRVRYAFQGVKINGITEDFFAGVDAKTFGSVMKLDETEKAYERVADGGILVSKKRLDAEGWTVGEKIAIEFPTNGTQNFEIAGTFNEAFDSDLIVSNETYLKNIPVDVLTMLLIKVQDNVEVSVAKEQIKTALAGYPQIGVQDKGDLFETAKKQIDQILALFWGLLAFAINIAVLGITNTLMLSISERTRELGMLRAIGMTRSQMRRMIRYESIIIALFGAVLGVAMGAFFAWAVLRALATQGIEGYVFPTTQIILYFVLAIFAGIIAAAWPARKAARMDILKAIYHD